MIFFTSDLHLGHKNIIRLCGRPFESVEEMDEILIDNWNKKIHRCDTVYILGDILFRNEKPAARYLERLKGRKHLIVGNHDAFWMRKEDYAPYFESITRMLTFSDGKHRITACHYPMLSWPGGEKSYMLFGHIHQDTDMRWWPVSRDSKRLLNVGVDINGLAPVTFDELVMNNEAFKENHQ